MAAIPVMHAIHTACMAHTIYEVRAALEHTATTSIMRACLRARVPGKRASTRVRIMGDTHTMTAAAAVAAAAVAHIESPSPRHRAIRNVVWCCAQSGTEATIHVM